MLGAHRVVLVALFACNSQPTMKEPPDAPLPPIDAPAVIALAFDSAPVFSFPSTVAPLAGKVELTTNRPTRVSLVVTDATRSFTIAPQTLATTHRIPVLGLRAATTHAITITVTDELGDSIAGGPLDAVTPPLPQNFPTFTTLQMNPAQTEPGITLLATRQELVIAVDAGGHVIWYMTSVDPLIEVHALPGGTMLGFERRLAFEFDVFGTVLRTWHVASMTGPTGSVPVDVEAFHHELFKLPSGNFLGLTSERRPVVGFPTSETDPTPRVTGSYVIGDELVEFAPDGTIVRRYSMFDKIDRNRIAYDSFGNFWNTYYQQLTLDWTHGNAIAVDPTGGYLVSLRHQDAVIKLDAAGNLAWILGPHDNWSAAFAPYLLTPVGAPFGWSFHQHSPMVMASGNVLVFDNGNYRVSPPTPKPPSNTYYSRAVEYAIDPVAKEVRQVWEYDGANLIYGATMGDVDVGTMTGNVIISYGSAKTLVEVTHATPAVPVFQLTSSDAFYRSERIPSLYW